LEFTPDGVKEIARIAAKVNERMENIGARRLHTVMTTLLEDVMFELPDYPSKHIVFDGPGKGTPAAHRGRRGFEEVHPVAFAQHIRYDFWCARGCRPGTLRFVLREDKPEEP